MKRVGGICVLLLIALQGCSRDEIRFRSAGLKAQDYDEAASAKASMPMSAGAPPVGGMVAASAEGGGQSPSISLAQMEASRTQRYLIRDATITMEAKDVGKAVDELKRAALAAGGYVGNSNESMDPLGGKAVMLQVRVPASRFDGLMSSLDTLGKVMTRNITSQDVTAEYVDTDSRVRNLKRTEERLLAHLGRSGKLSDTLSIERELTRVREEIEQATGRLRFLAGQVAFSTATVTITETARARALTPPESYSAGQTVGDATRSLVAFGRSLLGMVIWVVVYAVVWLPVALILWWAIIKPRMAQRRGRP